MNDEKISFKEHLELRKYSPVTIYNYTLYCRIFNNENPTQTQVDRFLKQHNNNVVRAFMKIYLYEYLEIYDIHIMRLRGRSVRHARDKGLDY